ncbi:unnamed protein product [Rotaria sordida]|uniref:Protein translocase subunit SecA n=1 Tax=Rotaria sordida TaxID=392033 RepID=A0A819M1N2_9BILA|nr:unnamed protein product [Rotaria sordida]CAF3972351.1 unnamed protein product [Rotaria sordida]
MLTGHFYSELTNKLNHMKGELRIHMDPHCLFLDIFGRLILEHENQESDQLEQNFSQFLMEFIDLVMESRVDLDHSLLSKLCFKSLPLWKLPLEKKILANQLDQISLFKHAAEIDKSITIDYLYKIGDEKGKDILTHLLELIKNIKIQQEKFVLSQLNQLLEDLTFGGFTLDQDSLGKLEGESFDQWETILKAHTESQFRELNVKQLIEFMREKTGERKINEPIKHLLDDQFGTTKINKLLERIYSLYGKRFNEQEKPFSDKKRQSKICTSLSNKLIMNWTKDDIRQWADKLREEKRSHKEYFNWDKDYLQEMMAVIVRAAELYHGYHPRNIQLIALGIFLEPHTREKGRLGNISTGERKSLITAMLATAQALIGRKVDIVTSSKILAIRDASDDPDEGYKELYRLFGLKVSNNCDDACENPKTGQAERKDRYLQNEIIYGETAYFQRDILLTKFFAKDIRDRIGDILIVDEVDNMVIDNAEKTLYISHGITDMRHLRDVFIQIWVSVNNKIEQSYSEENVNKIHQYIQLMIENKDLKIPNTLKDFVDRNLKTWIFNAYCAKYVENNDNYIIGDVESNKHGEILIMDKDTGVEQLNTRWSNGLHIFLQLKHCGKVNDESLKAVFISNMNFFKIYENLNGMTGTIGGQEERELLSLEYGVDCFELPRFRKYRFQYEKRKECVCESEHEWCEQIITDINEKMDAKRQVSQQERNEIEKIKNESEISLAGIMKELEQLIQQRNEKKQKNIELYKKKHEYGVEKQDYIKKVEETLNNNDQKKLSEIYKSLEDCEKKINIKRENMDQVDQVINSLDDIIRFRQTQQTKLERNIQNYQQILESGENRDRRRAVLVICENITNLEKIAGKIRQVFQSNRNYNIYTYDRAYRKFEKSELNPGDIIIATNIAGRGTDLTIDKLLEANGGLHVILSYIPGNLRVQQQVFGRTARGGKRGTGVYIVYDPRKLMFMPDITVDFLLNERDEKEKERLQDIVSKSFPKIKIENNLFDKFNLFKEEIKSQINESVLILRKNSELDFNANYLELQLNSLQNHWAFWLNEMNEKLTQVYCTGSVPILKEFSKFKNEIVSKLSSNTFGLITEPGELIKLSKLYMDNKKYKEAQDCYDRIIEKHPDFSDIAHYYKAFCIIHLEGGDKEEKIRAKTHLKKALDLLESKRSTIMSRNQIILSLNQITQRKGEGLNVNYFKQQNEGEAQILSYHINAILEAIGSEIGSENFRNGKITGDIPAEVYKELLKDDYDMIKDNRISKKIIIGSKVLLTFNDNKWKQFLHRKTQEGNNEVAKIERLLGKKDQLLTYDSFRKLSFSEEQYRKLRCELQNQGILSTRELYKTIDASKDEPQCIIFPSAFKYCQEEILNDLELILLQSREQNWTYKKRIIKENFFESRVFHRQIFLDATRDIVKQRDMIKISDDFKDYLVGKLDDPVFCSLGNDIKKLLLGKKLILLNIGDRINRKTFFKTVFEKLNLDEIKSELIETLLNDQFEETIEIVIHVPVILRQTLAEKLKGTVFNENISQIQDTIQYILTGCEMFPLSAGDIIQKSTWISTLKNFKHNNQIISEEQIKKILKYLEFNEILRIDKNLEEKFSNSTNNQVFCGKKEKIKKFFLGKESYTLTSGEIVSLQPDENNVSKDQLNEVMNKIGITNSEKINDIFNHLALEFYRVKFIHSYTEFYLENHTIEKIKNYLSKISFIVTDENKEEIKQKIKMSSFIQIGSLNSKSTFIKRILLETIDHNEFNLTRENFCMSPEDFELLRGILLDNGIIEPKLYELLSQSYQRNSSDRKKSFYSHFENSLIILYNSDGRISEENLSLRTANEVSKDLWHRLRELTVIKEAKVHFKFTNDPEKRIEIIKEQIENVVKKVFHLRRQDDIVYQIADWTGFQDLTTSKNKELDEYIDSITNILKHAAGVFRTLPKVKIEEKNLKSMFQTGKIPPELMDYIWMCFDSVLSLKEDKGFWNWDAFACAMIGIAQIVAGIAIDICTCGAGHYFAQVLISEGIGDIVFAIQSDIQGNFSWKAYCQHKVQSVIISLLTAGVGSYLSKGAQAGKMAIGLATKTAILKAIGKETLTQLITGVTSAIVNITTDHLSQFVMNEIVDKHFVKIFDQWIKSNEIYKEKKMKLTGLFENVYKKFGAIDATNIINDIIHTTLLDLQHGDIANVIFNRVTQITHGISGAYSSAARTFPKGSSKAILFSSIAKVIDKTVHGVKFYKNLLDICDLCNRFCEILNKKLSERLHNSEVKSDIEKIREENRNISISVHVSQHITLMEDQMKFAMKEKVKNDFLKPGIQFTLNHAVKPIREFITSPFANAMGELKEHIDQRADEYMKIIENQGHEALSKLNSRKKRALEQLGALIDVKNLNPQVLKENVSNLNGQSIENLIKQHGDNVKIAVKNGKLLAVLPTYKEYMDNIEMGIFAGPMHLKLAAEKFKMSIEILDPENGFQPHTDAPDGGMIHSTKSSNEKPIKMAHIKSKEKGTAGHFAPVIEVDGEYKIVQIKQNTDTTDKCFAQTMLFIQKYNEGNIKDIDFDSTHDFGISKDDINKFNKGLAQLGRSSRSMRQVYNQGLTLEHPEFLGGRTIRSYKKDLETPGERHPDSEDDSYKIKRRKPQPQPTFPEIFEAGTYPRAGKYGALDKKLRGRKGILEINHVPSIDSYKGTSYEDIAKYSMPAIAMRIEDHKAFVSTGWSYESQHYRKQISQYMQNNDMYNALRIELCNVLKYSDSRYDYTPNVREFIDYVASQPIRFRNAPSHSQYTTMITQEEASKLRQDVLPNQYH